LALKVLLGRRTAAQAVPALREGLVASASGPSRLAEIGGMPLGGARQIHRRQHRPGTWLQNRSHERQLHRDRRRCSADFAAARM